MKALWFSGGKDSMACLYLLKKQLHGIKVLFCDTGKNYPELIDTVRQAALLCPHFEVLYGDRDKQWVEKGIASDVVPIDWTTFGQEITSKKDVTIQAYLQCCYENIAEILVKRTRELGITTVIRGQRADEAHRSTAKHGETHQGLTFEHPIEGWTKDEVLAYLKHEMGKLPEHYAMEHSSLDCYDCVAYGNHSKDRVEWMKFKYPVFYATYENNLNSIKKAIRESNGVL